MRIFLISMLICIQIEAEVMSRACGYGYKKGVDTITLDNNGMGWFEVYNKTAHWVKLVNAQKPQYVYFFKPWGRRSFNWHGKKEVMCFMSKLGDDSSYKPTTADQLAYDKDYVPVSCSEVIKLVVCEDQDTRIRYNDLHLIDYSKKTEVGY